MRRSWTVSQETENEITAAASSAQQTLTAIVENEAGVLARVVGLFARRGFNISALAVAPTEEDPCFSRITFVYEIGSAPVEQVVNQINKLVNVISIEPVDVDESARHELMMATISGKTPANA
jgi:acetolactate synthase-1/3 small subunit